MADEFQYDSLVSRVRNWFRQFTGPRKYKRFEVDFSSTMRIRVTVGAREIEVALADVSRGGLGFEVSQGHEEFEKGQILVVKISSDGKNWEEANAMVRYVLPPTEQRLRAFIGLQFEGRAPQTILKMAPR